LVMQFKKSSWVTMASDQEGYRIRLLSNEEKEKVQKTVEDYRQMKSAGIAKAETETWTRVSAAFKSLPADLRSSRILQIVNVGVDFVELKDAEFHMILPMKSIRIVLLGNTGDPSNSGSAGQSSIGRGDGFPSSGFNGGGLSSFIIGGGRMPGGTSGGRVAIDNDGSVRIEPDSRDADANREQLKIFTLQYADAASLSEVLDALYGKQRDMRIVPEKRTNAIIVKSDRVMMEELEALILQLDKKVPVESADK